MAVNEMRGAMGYQASLGEFWQLGFRLDAPDDHVLFLLHENERIAVFSQTGARAEAIQNECATWLLEDHQLNRRCVT